MINQHRRRARGLLVQRGLESAASHWDRQSRDTNVSFHYRRQSEPSSGKVILAARALVRVHNAVRKPTRPHVFGGPGKFLLRG
jgi:hypothetical protein